MSDQFIMSRKLVFKVKRWIWFVGMQKVIRILKDNLDEVKMRRFQLRTRMYIA